MKSVEIPKCHTTTSSLGEGVTVVNDYEVTCTPTRDIVLDPRSAAHGGEDSSRTYGEWPQP